MNDMSSLLFATTILALGGLGLFMLKGDENDNETDNNVTQKGYGNEICEDNECYENTVDVIEESYNKHSNGSGKTRRNKKRQRQSRRKL